MYDFLLQLFFISSLAVMVYLMARALPRVANGEEPKNFYYYLEQWLERLPVHKVDERLNNYFFKTLKKVRVVVMRVDNKIVHGLNRIKKNGENGNGHGNGNGNGSIRDLLNK